MRIRAAAIGRRPAEELQKALTSYPPAVAADGDCAHGAPATLGELVQPSDDPGIVYALKPDLDACYVDAFVHTNHLGFRSRREVAAPKPAGTYRILLLGDSQAFGWGVSYDDSFAAMLERELTVDGGRTVEIVNTGVPGYNAAQEAAVLERYARTLEPDCAIVLFIDNDLGLPAFMLSPPDVFELRSSYLLTALFGRRSGDYVRHPWIAPGRAEMEWQGDQDPDRVPPPYRYMVGVDGYRRALASMARTAQRNRIAVVDFADYEDLGASTAAEMARANDAARIMHPPFRFPRKRKFQLNARDPHLNAGGHRKIADQMLAALRAGACESR